MEDKINKVLNDFWENDVWNCNYNNIYNTKIKNILKKIQFLNKNKNYNSINELKEENLNYLKTQAILSLSIHINPHLFFHHLTPCLKTY